MNVRLPSTPFVLLDDARAGSTNPARLYRDAREIVRADRLEDVMLALERLRSARKSGLHAAGYIAYEAGYALEPRLAALEPHGLADGAPLLWFGLFECDEEIAREDIPNLFPGMTHPIDSGVLEPLIARADYDVAFHGVQEKIRAGDIYQVNLTFPCHVGIGDDPAAFYGAVRSRAAAGHGALLFTGEHWLISFSPELFFMLEDGLLSTRPMKGTALRDDDPARDAANAEALRADPKQRAENLMIVDLLRNDLSRVSVPGSVNVPELFTIESYPTVHQMTSTVTAHLCDGLDVVDAIKALFPCGSITGAPKIRAMEIIYETERQPRGPYTGSIGVIDAKGDACFNVAIRTVCVEKGATQGVIGLGSGLVADSQADSEWNECLDKGRFLGTVSEPVTGQPKA